MKTFLAVLIGVAVALVAVPCTAGPRVRSVLVHPTPRQVVPPGALPRSAGSINSTHAVPAMPRTYSVRPYSARPYSAADDYRDLYPKYQGGFHSRYFDHYGFPAGDIGIRGNSLYWTPW